MLKVVVVFFAIITAVFPTVAEVAVPIPDQPAQDASSPTNTPTKNQWAIIAQLVSVYERVRTCVRYAYDEICYWEGVVKTYKQIDAFFKTNGALAQSLGDKTTQLFTDPKDVFVTLDRLEVIFDDVDNLCYKQPGELDKLLCQGEKYWDKLASDTVIYTLQYVTGFRDTMTNVPGVLIPNTSQILGFIDKQMFGTDSAKPNGSTSTASSGIEEESSIEVVDLAEKRFDDSQRDTAHQNWPETRLRMANELVASYAMANSAQYRLWAARAMNKVSKSDKHFADNAKNVNEKELSAAWYALENVNANNKRIRHSALEAKVIQAMLGTQIFSKSLARQQQMNQAIWCTEVENSINTVIANKE